MGKPTIWLTYGIPGSGKSTKALEIVEANPGKVRRVNLDDLRDMMDNNKGDKFFDDRSIEDSIQSVHDGIVKGLVDQGYDVVVDNCHVTENMPKRLRRLFGNKVNWEVIDCSDVPIEVCLERDAARERSVGKNVIEHLAANMKKSRDKGYVLSKEWMTKDLVERVPVVSDPRLPGAIICDLDGTLALNLSGRSVYDTAQCEKDSVCEPIAELLEVMSFKYDVILCSGRKSEYRPQTLRWLDDNGIMYDMLLMRPVGDNRKDSEVKLDLFNANVRGKYNVAFVLDDRTQVVELWRDLGLLTFQVAWGNY